MRSFSQGQQAAGLVCLFCGILVPRPGIEPVPPAVEAWSPNPWTAREAPEMGILNSSRVLLAQAHTTYPSWPLPTPIPTADSVSPYYSPV